MKRIFTISFTLLMTLVSCSGQTRKTDKQSKENLPQTNIKVNKQYDKNGNIVKYDSTYSSYYSNIKGDSSLRDSVFNKFEKSFDQKFAWGDDPVFKKIFFNDSLLKNDFYKNDFFYKRFRNNLARMDSLFRNMDRMKNDFFDRQFQSYNKGDK